MPMKPKTKVMASATMLSVTIGFGALFVYIEEKKFEAMGYQQQLQAAQQALIANKNGYHFLVEALALANDDLAELAQSPQLQLINQDQAREIVTLLRNSPAEQSFPQLRAKFSLTEDEILALQSLSRAQP